LLAGPLTENGTQPGLSQPLNTPSDCGGCHGNYASTNIEPFDTWAGSMMAQASRDPLFWAALDVANNDIADVGDFCLRCHVPIGWLNGRSEPQTDGCGFEGKMDETNKDFDGLSCHFCHRMMINSNPPTGQQSVYFENGQYWIDDSTCGGAGEPCRRGPYDFPPHPEPPHAWDFSQYHVDSDSCGNCHNVTHPVKTLIVNGTDTGVPMPIERTFKEWQQSDFAPGRPEFQTCQNCHMPDATDDPAYACSDQTANRTGDMPVHRFVGGNAWMPDVLRQEYPSLDIANELTATRNWALEALQNDSATVEVLAPTEVLEGQDLDLQVKVTNHTGHKLPTGYPEGRRMWLHVEARDGVGGLIWESGAYNAATGDLYHDTQIKVYHTEPGIWNRNGTGECDTVDGVGDPIFHFVLNDCIAVDNRIPPLGFTGMSDLETRPVGYAYPETSPGSGILVNYDTTDYVVPIPSGTATPVTVTATLRYQTTSREYVDFLLAQATTNGFPTDCIERGSGFPTQSRGEILYAMWNSYGKSAPVDMDSGTAVTSVVTITTTPGEASAAPDFMRVTGFDPSSGDLTISYARPCDTSDHTVYYGNLNRDSLSTMSFSGQVCLLGPDGPDTINLGSGSQFWVVVANNGSFEGSYGTDSDGLERPEDTSLVDCSYPQELVNRCDP
jgi:hypothetical protein